MNKTLLKAIFDCKKDIPTIEKKAIAKMGSYSYKYADLPDVQAAIKIPMEKNGLIFIHKIVRNNDREILNTALTLIETGEEIVSSLEIPPGKFQERGGSITYAKRYNIGCLLDLVLDEDIDGPKEENKKQNTEPPSQATSMMDRGGPAKDNQLPSSIITDAQRKRLFAIGNKQGWNEEKIKAFIKARYNLDSTKSLTRFQYDFLVSAIEKESINDKTPHGNRGSIS